MNAGKHFYAVAVFFACLVFNSRGGSHAEDGQSREIKLDGQILAQQLFSIAHNKVLLKELEIVDAQASKLNNISQDFQRKLVAISMANSQRMIEAQTEGKSVNYDDYLKPIDELSKQMEAELEKILLAHQVKRIKQLAIRQQLQLQSGYADDLALPLTLAKQLTLSAAEVKALKKTVAETRSAYEEKVQKLQSEARDTILKTIPADKRKAFLEIVGETFDFTASQRALRENFESARPLAAPLIGPDESGSAAEDKPKK